jgi:hypothetical protein
MAWLEMKVYLHLLLLLFMSRDSAVGIATRYGLDGPGFESRWGRDFPPRPDRPWATSTLLNNGCRVSFPAVMWSKAWHWPPTQSSAEVKGRVQLYHNSPSGHPWPVPGWNLVLHLLRTAKKITYSLRMQLSDAQRSKLGVLRPIGPTIVTTCNRRK